MAPDDTETDAPTESVTDADRANGEPAALDEVDHAHHDDQLDERPDAGQMPSDVDVQAERQEPLSAPE